MSTVPVSLLLLPHSPASPMFPPSKFMISNYYCYTHHTHSNQDMTTHAHAHMSTDLLSLWSIDHICACVQVSHLAGRASFVA